MTEDPFATARIRETVLAGWRTSPIRFREDANTEEDLAFGGYRDRVVVELAQNAADAAVRAGIRGKLLLRLARTDDGLVLLAANTGAPLDAKGVQALCTLRASDKALAPSPGPRAEQSQASTGQGHGHTELADGTPAVVPAEPRDVAGRFGVGFSAVLALTDEPAVVCRTGGVRFSAADTRNLVGGAAVDNPALGTELARRDGHVPVLRLPFPTEGTPPEGYDTAVLLPVRDPAAGDLAMRLLQEVGDPLLLALPGLAEIRLETPEADPIVFSDVEDRWWVRRATGRLEPHLLADRPTEERRRTTWSVTWALPRDRDAVRVPGVVHCPTPSDEPLSWPALLMASFPLDPSRRHVAPGPAADHIVSRAALAYAGLVEQRAAAGDRALELLPSGLPAGALDARLRDELASLLPRTPLLASAEDHHRLLCPPQAVALPAPAGSDKDLIAALAGYVEGLIHAPRRFTGVLAELRVRRIGLGEVLEQLPGEIPSPDRRRLWAALARLAADPMLREEMSGLPVPLSDGRVVRGARGLLLPSGSPAVSVALARLGVRVVRPDAVDPLLELLGALPLTARQALDLPVVRAVVDASYEDDPIAALDRAPALGQGPGPHSAPDGALGAADLEPDAADLEVTDAVLTLVAQATAAGDLAPGDLPWLADLALADTDGELTPAGALALPGSVAELVMDPEQIGVLHEDLLRRWGAGTMTTIGVLDSFTTVRWDGLPLDDDLLDLLVSGVSTTDTEPAQTWSVSSFGGSPDPIGAGGAGGTADPRDLDGWSEWVDDLLQEVSTRLDEPVRVEEMTLAGLVAVRDLDAVHPDSWAAALKEMAGEPTTRAAVLEPVRVTVCGDGPARNLLLPGYTAWWLRHQVTGGVGWADPNADPELARLLPPGPEWSGTLDPAMRQALGAVGAIAELDRRTASAVIQALCDPSVPVEVCTALRLWDGLGALAAEGEMDVDPPREVRVLGDSGTLVVDADEAVVVDSPALLQRTDLGQAVVARREVAEHLAQLLDLPLASELAAGTVDESEDAGHPDEVPWAVRELLPGAPGTWCEHDRLLVDGVEVDWWVDDAGTVHACTLEGLAQGLAWAADAWHSRQAVAAVLAEPDVLVQVAAQETFEVFRA